MKTSFIQLNRDWNADPNVPDPQVRVENAAVILDFRANCFLHPRFSKGQRIRLRFTSVSRYRLGETNDEGWYRGQCRFSGRAPKWGEFYEVTGDLKLDQCPEEWISVSAAPTQGSRHFLFYLRDETFECSAKDWVLEI